MTIWARVRRVVFGAPKDVKDPHAFHKLSLVALLAWVGLGADGLSSSAYGPDEAFRAARRAHRARRLPRASRWRSPSSSSATATAASSSSSRRAAAATSSPASSSAPRVGVVSGAALLVDYVLTITISIASRRRRDLQLPAARAGSRYKLPVRVRGPRAAHGDEPARREGVGHGASRPIFGVFLVTHAILLVVAIGGHVGRDRRGRQRGARATSATRVERARHCSARSSSSCAPTRSAAARTRASRPSRTASG